MIKKYSQLKTANKYKIPTPEERRRLKQQGVGIEEFHNIISGVQENRKKLITEKLLPRGGRVPSTRNDWFQIVSREPTNTSLWRVTNFIIENGEETPSSHIVAQTFIEPPKNNIDYSVMESLYNVDWDAWEKQK